MATKYYKGADGQNYISKAVAAQYGQVVGSTSTKSSTNTGSGLLSFADGSSINQNNEIVRNDQTYSGRGTPSTAYQQALNTSSATKAISADALGAVSPISVPTPAVDTTMADNMAAGATQATKGIDAFLKANEQEDSEAQKSYDKILGDINSLLPGMADKPTDQIKAEEDAGLPKLKKDLGALNSQILSSVAGYEKALANEDLAPGETPINVVLGKQAVIKRNMAADIGLLQARALGLQGQIEIAQQMVDRAIDLKYETKEIEIQTKMQQLQLIQPILDKEERKQAAVLQMKYDEYQANLAEEKAKAKENISLAFSANISTQFANKGGEWFRVSDGKSYSTPEELFKDAGVTDFGQLYKMGRVTDLNAERLADIDFVSQLRAKYPDAGITINDTATTATQKLNGSRIYREQTRPPQYVTNPPSTPGPGAILGPDGKPIKLTAAQIDTISGFKNTTTIASDALTLLSSGVKTGPLAGRMLSVNKVFGEADPNQLRLEQTLAKLKADFMKTLSGAAVSEQEVKRLEKFLPSITDQEGVIKSKLNTLLTETSRAENNYFSTLGAVHVSQEIPQPDGTVWRQNSDGSFTQIK